MAQYSSKQDVTQSAYEGMSDSYHDRAAQFINARLIIPSGKDPSEISETVAGFFILREISVYYAIAEYCLESSNSGEESDLNMKRYAIYTKRYRDLIDVFDPRMLEVAEEKETSEFREVNRIRSVRQ